MDEQTAETQPLAITSCTIRRVWNLGNYENISIQATATVAPDQDAATVCRELRAWLEAEGPRKDLYGRYTFEAEEIEEPAEHEGADGEPDDQEEDDEDEDLPW